MPTVRSYTPSWLSSPPAINLFKPGADYARQSSAPLPDAGQTRARRTIARRGTEVFVAVGREIRWMDLLFLRDGWESRRSKDPVIKQEDSSSDGSGEEDIPSESLDELQGFRVLKTPLGLDIESLIMGPNETYLAVVTSHTVHICVVPDSSHLTSTEIEPLKPRFYQIGPTLHVTSKSAVASVLFHPLGVKGCTLVTVTQDANIRLWEFNQNDRWTFDQPTVSIDVKKLADGTTLDQDFSATRMGANQGFSPDAIEMQVASACFPARGCGGWASMSLWIAMTEGDVYVLCPLLPNKWAPPSNLIPSLSVSVVSNLASMEDDPDVSPQAKLLAQQQVEWMADIDKQVPIVDASQLGELPVEVFRRPARPGAIPKLQGPFEFKVLPESDDDLDIQLTDIFVIGPRLNSEELMAGEEGEELEGLDGLSLNVVCLLTTSGQLRVCLDVGGVEAQWLPPPAEKTPASLVLTDEAMEYSLVTFQTLSILNESEAFEEGWPMFSSDALSRYACYITHASSITYVSLAPWVFRLATELEGEDAEGADFRMDLLARGQNCERERLYAREISDASISLAAAVAIWDPDLGYMVLSATEHEPVCVVLEKPDHFARNSTPSITEFEEAEIERKPIEWHEPREPFIPPFAFEKPSSLPAWLDQLRASKHRLLLGQEAKLNPATLRLFTEVHLILSEETRSIASAAADMFVKADSLRAEFESQIVKLKQLAERVDDLAAIAAPSSFGNTLSASGLVTGQLSANDRMTRRIKACEERQEDLASRLEALRKKVAMHSSRPLSEKEAQFIKEIKTMHNHVIGEGESGSTNARFIDKTTSDSENATLVLAGRDSRATDNASNPDSDAITLPARTEKDKAASSSTLSTSKAVTLLTRYNEVVQVKDELCAQADALVSSANSSQSTISRRASDISPVVSNDSLLASTRSSFSASTSKMHIPADIRRAKLDQVRQLLERETALVEGVRARIERLSTS